MVDAQPGRRMDLDRLAELEEERRFLLRSLSDLERERAAGDVDEGDYISLRDGYTSRAATVLRAIDADRATLPARPPRHLRRVLAIASAVVVLGAGLGVLVARFASPRGSSDTISGGTDEDRIAALLSDGRSALNGSDLASATDAFTAVLDIDADNVEARTYLAWVVALTSQNLDGEAKSATLTQGKELLAEVTESDPTYADAFCFLAVIATQLEDDVPAAVTRRQQCLDNDPSAEMQGLIAGLVDPVIDPAPSTETEPASEPSDVTTGTEAPANE